MTHKSIICCNRCQAEEPVQDFPYPEGWGMVNTSIKGSLAKFSLDLCPGCFMELNAFLTKSA